MRAEKTLNRVSNLGAGLALILAIASAVIQVISTSAALGIVLLSAGLLTWSVRRWGVNASVACAISLLAMAVAGVPGLADWLPSWFRLQSWLGALAAAMAGLGLMSLRLRRRMWFNASVLLGAGIVTVAVLSLLNGAMGYASMRANIGALLAFLVGISLMVARMGPGFLQLMERRSPAGYIGRWMVGIVIFVPAILHILQLRYRPPASPAALLPLVLSSFAYTMALLGVLMFALRRLDLLELSRAEAQAERDRLMARLQQEAATLQQQVANRTQELATALKASMRFDYLARATTNGIMITDADGRIEWVNPAWERFCGYTLTEVQGRLPREFLHGSGTQTDGKELITQAVRTAQPARGEMINYRKNGEPFWIELEIQPMRNEAGEVANFFAIVSDITERRRAAEDQRQLKERLELALFGTNDGVWDADLETGRTFYDRRWAEIIGLTQSQVLAEPDAWKSRIHPDDVQRALTALNSHLAGEAPFYSSEFRMRHADGHWVWVLDRGRVVARDAQGRALRITGTHSDITARKALEDQLRKSEALLLQLGELAGIGAWEADLDSGDVTWSPEIYRIHEVELGYMPVYDRILEFYSDSARRVLIEAINAAADTGTPFDLELPFTTTRNKKLWVRVKGRTEKGTGLRNRVHGVFQDITGRREAEEIRRHLEVQLFQAQKMETLGTLAGGIAHDFNNLLTGILGYQDLALDTLEEGHPSRHDLAAAREASIRARTLVDQILTFSRQAGGEKVPVDLANVVEDALRFLRSTLPSTIRIEVDIAESCEPVLADATQIYQVILNLGSNAAHAMLQTGGVMRLTARPATGAVESDRVAGPVGGRRFVRMDFSDSGHGMSEETRKRIFDPFFTTKEVDQGTGLGLSVVHGIIESHQGTISAESQLGKGTTFTIHLPVAEGSVGREDDVADEAPRGNGERIAVVDDEDLVRSYSQMALERSGYRVESFDKSADCLEVIRARPGDFAMLLTDQTMPGMRGIDLATEVRKLLPELPVIIMSGYFSRIAPETLARLGNVDLLSKPFTNEELARAAHRSLNRH